jgi:hypothetical protein
MNRLDILVVCIIMALFLLFLPDEARAETDQNGEIFQSKCESMTDRQLKSVCEERRKNCYWGIPSHTLICRRTVQELLKIRNLYPANVVEIYGKVIKKDKKYMIADVGQDKNAAYQSAIEILPDSCGMQRVGGCERMLSREITVIGAYFIENGIKRPKQREYEFTGKVLVFDFFYGRRSKNKPEITE